VLCVCLIRTQHVLIHLLSCRNACIYKIEIAIRREKTREEKERRKKKQAANVREEETRNETSEHGTCADTRGLLIFAVLKKEKYICTMRM
jgi:hypothetical protein